MSARTQPWEDLIFALHGAFRRLIAQRSLLASIDKSILGGASGGDTNSIESIFHKAVVGLSEIFDLSEAGLCYAHTGKDLLLIDDPERRTSRPARITSARIACLDLKAPGFEPRRLDRTDTSEHFYTETQNPGDVVICPIYTPLGDPLCVFVFFDAELPGRSKFTAEFIDALRQTAAQLSIAYNHFWATKQNDNLRGLWDLFLATNLSPHVCFKTLAERVATFLPSFGPLTLRSEVQSQILVLHSSPSESQTGYLTIRATTGEEPDTTRIDISKSICGLLIEDPTLRYFCDDPRKRKYRKRYKDYLGAKAGRQIKTECAVRLVGADNVAGILNLESPDSDAFSIHQIHALLELAKQITPLVVVFEDRLQQNKLMHRSLVATTATYLDSIASVFRHGIATPIANLRTDIDLLKNLTGPDMQACVKLLEAESKPARAISSVLEKTERALNRLLSVTSQISEFSLEFSTGISGFGNFSRLDLREIAAYTIDLAQRSLLARMDADIVVELGAAGRADVFCSPLVKHHIFCLLNNAVLAIKERQAAERQRGATPTQGQIRISITKSIPKGRTQEVSLNEAFLLSIRDNGPGVTKDQLTRLRQFRVGTRYRQSPGMGQGLAAAQRFMASINGRIWLESEEGQFFEVQLYFDAYRKDIHEALVTSPT